MRVGVIGAMDLEVAYLREHLAHASACEALGMEFVQGEVRGVPVVVVRCGIGKVNAALCAQALVREFGATHVINVGVAGSLDARIDIGDIVVATDAVHHDMDVAALGYAPGQVPDMDAFSFAADEGLRAQAVRAVGEAAPEVRVFEGRVASGDQFVGTSDQKARIVSTFGALCCEMEGAAIAHACRLLGVPFVIVRAISDKADGSAQMDYPTFKHAAAARSAAIVEQMLPLVAGASQ